MSKKIQILKNGQLQDTLELESGTYALGRGADADIVLADSAVSKTHAVLSIEKDGFIVKDNGSSNGIFHQGKKFFEKRFKGDFEIEIKPFTINTGGNTGRDEAETSHAATDALRNFSINNIKLSIFLIFTLTMMLTILIGFAPLKKQTAAIQRQEVMKSGILLSRYLAEMNRPFLETGQNSMVRTSPIQLEDGVMYAFVLDLHGRIIAPHEKQGDFFNWSGLSNAFAGAKLKIEDGTQGEKIIFYPVQHQNETIGAAVIGFAYQQAAGGKTSGMGAVVFVLLAILFIIGLAMSFLLTRAFLNPLKSLYEEVEIAIKQSSTSINFKAPYKELEYLKRAFNRLLIRRGSSPSDFPTAAVATPQKPATGTSPGKEQASQAQATTKFPGLSPESADQQLEAISAPWCIINRESYTLVRFSDNFTPGLGTPDCKIGMHIIEALETDIIPAVSQMIDSESPDNQTNGQQIIHGDKTYTLRRINNGAEKNNVTLIFEDEVE